MTQADPFTRKPPRPLAETCHGQPGNMLPSNMLNVWLLTAFAILLGVAVQWDYILARYCESVDADRLNSLVGGIIAALDAAACIGGAMHFLDRRIATGISWPARWLLLLQKRIYMFAQLAAAGLAVYAASLMIFHKPVPNPLPATGPDTPTALYSQLPPD